MGFLCGGGSVLTEVFQNVSGPAVRERPETRRFPFSFTLLRRHRGESRRWRVAKKQAPGNDGAPRGPACASVPSRPSSRQGRRGSLPGPGPQRPPRPPPPRRRHGTAPPRPPRASLPPAAPLAPPPARAAAGRGWGGGGRRRRREEIGGATHAPHWLPRPGARSPASPAWVT